MLRRVSALGIMVLVGLTTVTGMGCSAGGFENAPSTSQTPQITEEYLKQRAEGAKSVAEVLGVKDPPEVGIVRFVDSDEKQQVVDQCLTDAGYSPNGDWTYDVPPGQNDSFNLAMFTCLMQYPEPIQYDKAWGDDQKHAQYEWTVDFVIPCLAGQGHPTNDVPSEGEFVASWDSEPFYPFSQVDITTGDYNRERYRLENECPQTAPGTVLWGDESIQQWMKRTGREQA